MNISISSLAFQGLAIGQMQRIPKDIGVEIFAECGNDYYWDHWLPRLLEGREEPLSVHATFHNLDLSDPEADFEQMRQAYHRDFALCRKYGAKHCVCHPYEGIRPANDTPEAREKAKQCSLQRVLQLNEEAKAYGVELLVENLPQANGLLDQQGFLDLFMPHEELHFLIDVAHAHLQKWDMDLAMRTMGDRLKGYHLSDNFGDYDAHLHAWEGNFAWEDFFAGYTKYTPQATLVCEYNEGPLDKILDSVARIRKILQEQ